MGRRKIPLSYDTALLAVIVIVVIVILILTFTHGDVDFSVT